jgi:glycyl-tRNA synthetase beta chain
MADFLLELFSEEIPARMQVDAISYLQSALQKGLNVETSKIFSTPRRLAVIIKNLPAMQPDISTELKGPKVDAPEAALNGFLKKNNLTLAQLENCDGIYFANIHQKGKPTAEILKTIIEETLAKFPWPKSMRWGAGETAWVRPLHSILTIFDGQIVPVQFAGLTAGNVTFGHRFLAPNAITINSPAEYEPALEKAFVVANREKRKALIQAQADEAARAKNLKPKADIGLLEEVVGLVEYPNVLVGKIDDKFMDLPPEVLTMVMRSHQKYFALQSIEPSPTGRGQGEGISPYFLITSNMKTDDDGKAIIAGNERVLRARFADARFFWDTDRKKPLSDWADGLKTVTYHAKLGTVADKVERVNKLAIALAEYVPNADKTLVARAADLCKADLVTGMVGEFAELQGTMGRYYASGQGEAQEVADAIRDHYKPAGAGDSVPTAPVSICIALADKLDTLVSMFAIGEKPTGSKDPFALRRAALGVIRILLENNLRISLSSIMSNNYEKEISLDSILVEEFIVDRLKVMLKEQNIRHDVISAVKLDDDLVRLVARAEELQKFITTENGVNLLAAYKRSANIVAAEEKKDGISYAISGLGAKLNLQEDVEKTLAELLEKTFAELQALKSQEKFAEAMQALAELRAPLDEFFTKIMVNCEDKQLRTERLRLLARVRDVMNSVANFASIEG